MSVRRELWDAFDDGFQKVVQVAHIDHSEAGTVHIETKVDVTGLVDAAKVIADQPPGNDFRHAAFIPVDVLSRAMTEGWMHDKAKWKQWANDPNNAAFRTWRGRL